MNHSIRFFIKPLFLLFIFCFSVSGSHVWGQGEFKAESSVATSVIYETPTLAKMSELYWAVSMLDINDNAHIDNFLLINECDLYKDYYHNEFEWQSIREAARESIAKNKSKYPLRFEFIRQIKLTEYDIGREVFGILDEYKINNVKRFNVPSLDKGSDVCGDRRKIYGYPKSIFLQLSRPFMLTELPVEPEKAHKYIDENTDYIRRIRMPESQAAAKMAVYETRDAYVVMQVKIFAYNGYESVRYVGNFPSMLTVLEGVKVYADKERQELFYEKSYRKRRNKPLIGGALKNERAAKKTDAAVVEDFTQSLEFIEEFTPGTESIEE